MGKNKTIDAVSARPTKQGFAIFANRENSAVAFSLETRDYPAKHCSPVEIAAQTTIVTANACAVRAPFARKLLPQRTQEVHRWDLDAQKDFATE